MIKDIQIFYKENLLFHKHNIHYYYSKLMSKAKKSKKKHPLNIISKYVTLWKVRLDNKINNNRKEIYKINMIDLIVIVKLWLTLQNIEQCKTNNNIIIINIIKILLNWNKKFNKINMIRNEQFILKEDLIISIMIFIDWL